MMESLLDTETELLYPGMPYESLQVTEKAKVEKTARDKYLAVLYLMRSGKHHIQLQNNVGGEGPTILSQPLILVKHTGPSRALVCLKRIDGLCQRSIKVRSFKW